MSYVFGSAIQACSRNVSRFVREDMAAGSGNLERIPGASVRGGEGSAIGTRRGQPPVAVDRNVTGYHYRGHSGTARGPEASRGDERTRAPARRRAEEGGACRSPATPSAQKDRRRDNRGRSDEPAEVDQQVDPDHSGRTGSFWGLDRQ